MSKPKRFAFTAGAVTASLALLLAGCADDDKPTTSSATPTSAVASSSTSAAASSSTSAAVTDSATEAPSTSASASESASGSVSSPEAASAASSEAATAALPAECAPSALKTKSKDTLTIATDEPVYEPWFVDNKPESGKGFEGAVAAAVAGKLGFEPSSVKWIRVPFDNVIKPGDLSFDFDINEFSITDDRKKAVDFSSGYFDVTQAVVALKANKAAGAKSAADLADAKLGAQIGTTSLKSITEIVKPKQKPAIYNTNDDAVKALQNGQIGAIVVDLPTALYMTSAQIENSTIVGQFENGSGTPEQFGLVLQKGSPLTGCVSQAVDALRADGTLAKLADQWIASGAGAPVLK